MISNHFSSIPTRGVPHGDTVGGGKLTNAAPSSAPVMPGAVMMKNPHGQAAAKSCRATSSKSVDRFARLMMGNSEVAIWGRPLACGWDGWKGKIDGTRCGGETVDEQWGGGRLNTVDVGPPLVYILVLPSVSLVSLWVFPALWWRDWSSTRIGSFVVPFLSVSLILGKR